MKRDLLADLSRAFVGSLPEEIREDFEERAGIMEFDAPDVHRDRNAATAAAYEDCKIIWLDKVKKNRGSGC